MQILSIIRINDTHPDLMAVLLGINEVYLR